MPDVAYSNCNERCILLSSVLIQALFQERVDKASPIYKNEKTFCPGVILCSSLAIHANVNGPKTLVQSMKSLNVNWLSWSLFVISGFPCSLNAPLIARIIKSVFMTLLNAHPTINREYQSIIATRYIKPDGVPHT